MTFCRECAFEVQETWKFCPNCKTAQLKPDSPSSSSPQPQNINLQDNVVGGDVSITQNNASDIIAGIDHLLKGLGFNQQSSPSQLTQSQAAAQPAVAAQPAEGYDQGIYEIYYNEFVSQGYDHATADAYAQQVAAQPAEGYDQEIYEELYNLLVLAGYDPATAGEFALQNAIQYAQSQQFS
jgi:hypothetical protein